MPNPIFQQLRGSSAQDNPMLQRLKQFQKTITGNPQQMVQNLLKSRGIDQDQLNQYIQQTNEIYKQFKGFM